MNRVIRSRSQYGPLVVIALVCIFVLAAGWASTVGAQPGYSAQIGPIKPVEPPRQLPGPPLRPQLVETAALMRAAQARATFGVSGAGLTVAVLDTGLRTTHVDFAGRVIAQRNFTDEDDGDPDIVTDVHGHGTNVAGIVCANNVHIGIAPGANVIPLKVLGNEGSGEWEWIAAALQWVVDNQALYNISVCNLSLGAEGNYLDPPEDLTLGISALIQTLRDSRVAVVIAAGNGYYTFGSQQGMTYPAIIPQSVSVGAVYDADIGPSSYASGAVANSTDADRITPFSQRLHESLRPLTRTDIFAPGAELISSGIETDTGSSVMHGTSQAAPALAGLVLLMQERYLAARGLLPTVDEIEEWLRSDAVIVNDGDDEDDNVTNTGLDFLRADALNAVGNAVPAPTLTILHPQHGSTITERMPVIRALIEDPGEVVDPESIELSLDEVPVTGFAYEGGLLTYQVPAPLSVGRHQVALTVADITGLTFPTVVSNFRVVLVQMDAGLHLFSLPYAFAPAAVPTPQQLFGIEGTQVARWWPGDRRYHTYPEAYASFVPPDAAPPESVVPHPPAGLGYFVKLPSEAALDLSAGQQVSDQEAYHIALAAGRGAYRGWNLIGCPFTGAVDWGSVYLVTDGVRRSLSRAIQDGITEGVLFGLRSTPTGAYYEFSSDPLSAVMAPFRGYWVRVLQDSTLVIYPPFVGGAQVEEAAPATGEGWRLQLVASAGGAVDPANYLGVSSAAGSGYSPQWAVGKPPAVDGRLRLSLVEREWGEASGQYAQVVKPAASRQMWELEVACEIPNVEVSLRWPELNSAVPSGTSLLLQDLDSGEEVFMRTSAGYSFLSGPEGGVRHLRIIAVEGGATNLTLSGISAQTAAGGTVAFTYALSQPGEVEAEIRNISGVVIKRFAPRQSPGGEMELLMWNGRSDRASKVPAGRYLLQLTARSDNGQTVQAIRPFEIIP